MASAVVLPCYLDIVLDIVVDLSHLDLIIHYICREVPVGSHFLHTLGQLVVLTKGLLSEIVEVELQGHQTVIGLEGLCQHLKPVIVDGITSQIQVDQRPVFGQCLRDRFSSIVPQPISR